MARRWSRRIERDDKVREEFKKQWHKYQRAFLSAVQYLHDRFLVHDESYLPSANMLATLTVFFFHHSGQPNAYQAREIRKWFWATGVGKRYSAAEYHRNIVADAQLFGTLALGAKRHFSFAERLDPVLDIQGEKYNYRYQPFPQLIHPLCQGDFQHLIQILDPCAQNLKGQQFAIGLICIIIIALHYPIPLK